MNEVEIEQEYDPCEVERCDKCGEEKTPLELIKGENTEGLPDDEIWCVRCYLDAITYSESDKDGEGNPKPDEEIRVRPAKE